MTNRFPWWCDDFGSWTLVLAFLFLLLALVSAGVETFAAVKAKLNSAKLGSSAPANPAEFGGLDPAALLKAAKELLDSLKGLPAWIAIFLAGLALLWVGSEVSPEACKVTPAGQQQGATGGQQQPGQGQQPQQPRR